MTDYGEPWHIEHSTQRGREDISYIRDADGDFLTTAVSDCGNTDCHPMPITDHIERIVACVNACRGLTDEELALIDKPVTRFIRLAIADAGGKIRGISLREPTFRRFIRECESLQRTLVPAQAGDHKSPIRSLLYEGVEIYPA